MSSPLYGLILAGGKSTRMGQDKASLKYHNEKIPVAFVSELISDFVEAVYVSCRESQLGASYFAGLPTITDQYDIDSPLNGILSAMTMEPSVSWLVIAIDMPFISKAAVEILLSERDNNKTATAFISPAKGGPEPLFAIWEGHAKADILSVVNDKKVTCPRRTLMLLNTHMISTKIDDKILMNVNTKEEYELLKEPRSK